MYTEPKAKKGQNSCQESTKKGKNRYKIASTPKAKPRQSKYYLIITVYLTIFAKGGVRTLTPPSKKCKYTEYEHDNIELGWLLVQTESC
jgi:hypothetical protein